MPIPQLLFIIIISFFLSYKNTDLGIPISPALYIYISFNIFQELEQLQKKTTSTFVWTISSLPCIFHQSIKKQEELCLKFGLFYKIDHFGVCLD